METLVNIGIIVVLVGTLIALLGAVAPLALGMSKEKWYPKVSIVTAGTGAALMLTGLGIVIYAALHLPHLLH